ncbi:FAD-dependent monooxygenase [Amycolatopsis sp. WGS_07]|uniref:FAD-dependent monooxygenase n=1 Tax=Amycolatopsis sp. WGS_07 TaxID=3076764 RepID=UPI0038739F80
MRDPEVLVVGAGPVGLTVAHELVRRSVRIRLVDRAEGPATTSRALSVHARTLEICHQMGLVDALLPRGRQIVHFTLHLRGRTLVRFDTNYADLPTRYPYSIMVDQVLTEQTLRESLSAQGVEVEWNTELVSFAHSPDGVRAVLRDQHGEHQQAVPWMVGTDGAHSVVRRTLGFPLLGDSTETWLNADVMLDVDLPTDSHHLVHDGSGTLLCVPFPTPGKWRVIDTEDTAHDDDPVRVRARVTQRISKALGRPVAVSEPSWISVFTVQQRRIERMHSGRCFLAGDAAHVHSPASGQGMNTGIQDGHNLAWKLASVVKGHSDPSLLDSYDAERVPVGKTLLASTRKATALVALRNALAPIAMPAGLAVVNRVRPLKQAIEGKMIRGFCGLGLHYRESPLSVGAPDRAGFSPGDRVGCSAETERASVGWHTLYAEEMTDPRWTLLCTGEAGAVSDAISVRTVSERGDSGPGPLADPGAALRRDFWARSGRVRAGAPGRISVRGRTDRRSRVRAARSRFPSLGARFRD